MRFICRARFCFKNKKGDAAISAAAEKNKKEDAGLANIGNGLIAPRSQLGFGTVPKAATMPAAAATTQLPSTDDVERVHSPVGATGDW